MGVNETKQATRNLYRLVENLHTRLTAANTFSNGDLTPDALQRTRESMAVRSRTAAQGKAQTLLNAARDGVVFAQSRLDDARPKVDPGDVASLTRAAQAWQIVIEPARAAGTSWFDIAKTGDLDTLAALTRFGEQRIKLDDPGYAPTIISNLHAAIDQRLADIHPDDSARQMFADAKDARDNFELAQRLADAATAVNPTTLVEAIVSAKSYAHSNGIDLPTDRKPTVVELDQQVTQPQFSSTSLV